MGIGKRLLPAIAQDAYSTGERCISARYRFRCCDRLGFGSGGCRLRCAPLNRLGDRFRVNRFRLDRHGFRSCRNALRLLADPIRWLRRCGLGGLRFGRSRRFGRLRYRF